MSPIKRIIILVILNLILLLFIQEFFNSTTDLRFISSPLEVRKLDIRESD